MPPPSPTTSLRSPCAVLEPNYVIVLYGGPGGIRTHDSRIKSGSDLVLSSPFSCHLSPFRTYEVSRPYHLVPAHTTSSRLFGRQNGRQMLSALAFAKSGQSNSLLRRNQVVFEPKSGRFVSGRRLLTTAGIRSASHGFEPMPVDQAADSRPAKVGAAVYTGSLDFWREREDGALRRPLEGVRTVSGSEEIENANGRESGTPGHWPERRLSW